MACKDREAQSLQARVIELERQLAEAQAAIQALTPLRGDTLQSRTESQGQAEIDSENLIIDEVGVRRAIFITPHPLMIRRDDGQVVMVNAAWTEITGYTVEDIPTIDEWTRNAYGESASERKSEILNKGFSRHGIKLWGEYEITTRSGEKRIWDFSTAPLGIDQKGRKLVIAMAVDITERKQAEEKLRAVRDEATWLARFPGENPNPVIRVSTEGIVLYCNLPAASLRGWRCEVDSVLSRPLLDLVELAMEQGKAVEQDRLLGDKFYSVSVIPILGQGYLNLYGKDITERREVEKALAESERRQREITRLLEVDQARLAAILKHLPVGLWIVDEQGRLMGSNPEADRIWAGEAPLDSIADYQKYVSWYPGSGELLKPEEYPIAVTLRTGETVERMETNIRRFDGSEGTLLVSAVPIKDGQGRLMGVVAVNVDITDLKKTEEKLRESEAKYRSLVETAFEGVWVVDTSGHSVFVNNRMAQMLKYDSPEDLMNRSAFDFVPPEDLNEIKVNFSKRLSIDSPEHYDVRLQCRDGAILWTSAASNNVLDKNGNIIGRMALFMDITERKRMETALRESEERYRGLFEKMQEGLVAAEVIRDEHGNPIDYRYLEVNPATERQFGIPREQFIGCTYREVLPEGNLEWIDIFDKVARTGEPVSLERYGKASKRWFECHVYSPRPGQVVNITTDITERKQAEEALRESERRLNRAQEIAHLGSWELDLTNNRLTWSDEVYRIFGLQPQEFGATYEAFLEAVHPDDRAAVDNAYSSSIREGRDSYEIEHRVVKYSSGEVRIVHEKCEHFRDQSGRIARSMGMVHDITERKQAEEALRESEERFHSLADSMPQLVWTALPDGTVDYYNQRHQEYKEIKQVEGTAWKWVPVLHPDDLQPTVDAWQRSVGTGEIYQLEHRVQKTDGSYRWHLSRGVPVRDESGSVIRWFGTATDIHDLKQAEEQLKVYANRLEQSNRELEEFAFMASHDLQEPLRKIEMFGDMLLERAPCLNEQERNYIDRMRNASGRMRDMVEGLLQLSRVTTQGKPFASVNLSQVTSEVLHDLESQIRRTNGKVRLETLPTIEGDALQLHQLMQNLIGNALKYHRPEMPPEISVYAKQLSGKVQILVEDQGIGFAQEDAERVFQPFQRLVGRSQYEGSGMGLAICRRIVERHGGQLAALSKPGSGTTFIVTLPIHSLQKPRTE